VSDGGGEVLLAESLIGSRDVLLCHLDLVELFRVLGGPLANARATRRVSWRRAP
jgi:hypothetical protein